MARNHPPDDDLDFDLGDDEIDKDFSVLLAEAAKIKADSAVAVRKVALWDDTESMLARANELTAWGRRPHDRTAD
jgi:hypothetical protein